MSMECCVVHGDVGTEVRRVGVAPHHGKDGENELVDAVPVPVCVANPPPSRIEGAVFRRLRLHEGVLHRAEGAPDVAAADGPNVSAEASVQPVQVDGVGVALKVLEPVGLLHHDDGWERVVFRE